MGSGGGSSGPTLQQQQLQTQQALTTANLNLEENDQRKSILNSMMGTRVFRGSALSRAMVGNTPGGGVAAPGPSQAQTAPPAPMVVAAKASLVDQRGSGNTPAGGTGASGGVTAGSGGGYRGSGAGANRLIP